MLHFLNQWIAGCKAPRRPHRVAPRRSRVRPAIEGLEGRQLMTVTYGGGALLPNVQVQALYYGSEWSPFGIPQNTTAHLDGFLGNIVNSSYMDMLSKDSYGVGRGSSDPGWIDPANIQQFGFTPPNVTDLQLQTALQAAITGKQLTSPNSNNLYVIYVEPNVEVISGPDNSVSNFYGYHSAFSGHDASGNATDIHYAVIAYPGGDVFNASIPWLSAIDQLTEVTSHELAEAVTDPDVPLGWSDPQYPTGQGEVGDIVNAQMVYLNGYAVQRIADQNDQAMTPAGATAQTQESFVLDPFGNLWKIASNGAMTELATGVTSLSDQSIDNHGQVMVDYVTIGGQAYEYHEGVGSNPLTILDQNYTPIPVKSVKSGQGVSYLLLADPTSDLFEYHDSGRWTFIASGVASIDAGTDKIGVNMVDVVMNNPLHQAWEISDSSEWHYISSGVSSVSAGQQGISVFLTTGGVAYEYDESANSVSYLWSNVAQVTAGTDQNGNFMCDLIDEWGDLYEYQASNWTFLNWGIKSIAKAHAGYVAMTLIPKSGFFGSFGSFGSFSFGAEGHDASGWHFLFPIAAQTAS